MKIGTVFEISYAHRILNHPGKCSNLHGHNGTVEIEIDQPVTEFTGMVLDFSVLKDEVRDWIIRHFDHVTILQESDPLVESIGGRLVTLSHPPTAEMISTVLLWDGLVTRMPNSLMGPGGYSVRFWETEGCYVECNSKEHLGFKWHWDTR